MRWPFSKKTSSAKFSDPQAQFELQCKYGQTDVEPGQRIIAIVIDAAKELGMPVSIKVEETGRQTAALRVAAPDGGFIVIASTSGPGEPLAPGDLVMWVAGQWVKQLADVSPKKDPRFGWVGFIRAKVKPKISFDNADSWELLCRYD
jgi:hypothetical protein